MQQRHMLFSALPLVHFYTHETSYLLPGRREARTRVQRLSAGGQPLKRAREKMRARHLVHLAVLDSRDSPRTTDPGANSRCLPIQPQQVSHQGVECISDFQVADTRKYVHTTL